MRTKYNRGHSRMSDVYYMALDEDRMETDDEQLHEPLDENYDSGDDIMVLDYGSDEWARHPTSENPQYMDLT